MTQKILGLDLGTSSIGLALRDVDHGENLKDQLVYFSSDIFKAGVGKDKTGEYSFAAERTKHRQSRRLYQTRRLKLWSTLHLLKKYDLCPISDESLHQWETYDKVSGLKREYPVEDQNFAQWIALDFNGDGKPDYTSPYQLRRELVTVQLDFTQAENRLKLGRALYHIAQRRGFKSSKGETLANQENEEKGISSDDVAQEMKKSEMKLSKDLTTYMLEHDCKTAGQAFACLEDEGIRIRNSIYKAVRSQYADEISEMFRFQEGLSTESDLFVRLMSKKKGEGTIFFKKPLRSQKGLVGKCTLEPNKARCPESHPEYERFRALSLINNVKYRLSVEEDFRPIPLSAKQQIYEELFVDRLKSDFSFAEIRQKLEKILGQPLSAEVSNKTINFKDNQSVSGCPITARLIKMLGKGWENWQQQGKKVHNGRKTKAHEQHPVVYSAMDLWHVCFDSDDPEDVSEFANTSLGWENEQSKQLVRLWSTLNTGYAMLSLKAIRNINRFLALGLIYSDAVLLAKIPDILKDAHLDIHQLADNYLQAVKQTVDQEKDIFFIANSLIADYKSTKVEDRFADHNTSYQLDEDDHRAILKHIIGYVGNKTWELMDAHEQEELINGVTGLYQQFFSSSKREFYKVPRLDDRLKAYLMETYPDIEHSKWDKLYHPSQISLYDVPNGKLDRELWRLGSPNIGSIRNPVALRTLNILRRKINAMLEQGMITWDDTRIVVETTRFLSDANLRWAIETYQREREKENKELEAILCEYYPKRDINETDVDMARYAIEQRETDLYKDDKRNYYAKDITKYKLWLEQGGICLYTGKTINLTHLFDGNAFDIEHTLPRSKSFDSSDSNLTLCDAYYNRSVKKNLMPTELPNYEHDAMGYTAIKPRLQKWEERVERLQKNVEFWREKSKRTQDKSMKDNCIRQRHLWKMELDYWHAKLETFKMTEIKEGFRNSQLIDTGIIARYATLYLKSVFQNVDVEKGAVTASFRKILGIQSIDEKKSRDQHSHHAIDATTLTVVPIAAKRDRMLNLFYDIEEKEQLLTNSTNQNYRNAILQDLQGLRVKLELEKDDCHIGQDVSSVGEFIESNILINHHMKDQMLTSHRRRVRSRGKVVMVKNADGKMVEKWTDGDAVRGRLHNESYYGAIRFPQEEGVGMDRKPEMKDGKFVYAESNDIAMVNRVGINSFKSEADLVKIIDHMVRENIIKTITRRMENGLSFTESINKDIYMLDKYGHEITADKNGRPVNPIRHVRCKVAAGRGYMTKDKSLEIRHNIEKSTKNLVNIPDRSYKQIVYAQNDSNYLFLLYEGIKKGKLVRKDKIINTFEAAALVKTGNYHDLAKELFNEPYYAGFTEMKVEYKLSAILKVGTRVLMWKETPDELKELGKDELSKRLYIVVKFNNAGADVLYLRNHLNATNESDLKFVPNNFNCLIEPYHFEIDLLGNIIFKD
ncbi:MAG: type II CRISPR RNA-guided endonuclease Cas9 [Prevotella sp.]